MLIRKFLFLIAPLAIAITATGCFGRVFEEPARPTRTVHTPPPLQISEIAAPQAPQVQQPAPQPVPRRQTRRQQRRARLRETQTRRPQTIPAIAGDARAPQDSNQLGFHETTFDTKEKNRGINIARAAESINGKIVKPGEEFSFNEAVGPTIKSRGYEKAMVYRNGEKSEGEGGGVCQVSTTLHMAAKTAGMTILERHDHSLPVTYAQSGEEAATSCGVQDFKFKNDTAHPVQIKSHVSDGRVKVAVYAAR